MGRNKRRIGLIIDYLVSEYSENLIIGMDSYCKEKDIDFLLFTIGELHSPSTKTYNYQYVATTAQIRKTNVDGIVIASGTQMHGTSKKEFLSYLRSYKPLPIVNISMELDGIPSIVVDCDQAFDSLIQHLIDDQGCRKFGFMGVDNNSFDVVTRTTIFKNVMKRNGISPENAIIWKSNFDYASSYAQLDEYYLKHGSFDFDAIISLNDDMAFACMDFIQNSLKLKIPQDIIVTGFDDLQRCSFSNPPLTSVNQQVSYQAKLAAETLNNMLDNLEVPLLQKVTAKAVLRQSSAKKEIQQKDYENNPYVAVDKTFMNGNNNYNSVYEWYSRRSQLFKAAHFYSGMHHDVSLQEIGKVLTNQLRLFGFKYAAVVIYDNPIEMLYPFEYFNLPSKARLIGGFDLRTDFSREKNDDEPVFNPNDYMIPDGYIDYSGKGSLVTTLYHNSIQYGYIIISLEDCDFGVYDLVTKAVANQIAASFAYTQIINERSEINDKYNKLDLIAHTDELTGLKNRRGFMEMGVETMTFSKAIDQKGLILFCDMDGLKKINDTYGHEAGDTAIKAQGKILKKNFRSNDVVARIAGDEFAIISPGLSPEKYAEIKKCIEKDCKKWKKDSDSLFDLSISLGYVEFPSKEEGYDLNGLLAAADVALYIEKRRKKADKSFEMEIKRTRLS